MELRFQNENKQSFTVHYHLYDLPQDVQFEGSIAVDTETMGLNLIRDRLCLVQLCGNNGEVHLVHFPTPNYERAIRLKEVLADEKLLKIFHYGRFDMAVLYTRLQVVSMPIFCTKIAFSTFPYKYTGTWFEGLNKRAFGCKPFQRRTKF